MDDLERSLGQIGARLRALRQVRDLTLQDVSERTNVSVSTLSRLESGERRATLELLLPLAKTYGVTLDELVDAPPTGDPRVHLRPIKRHGMTVIPLSKRPGGIQAYKMVIPPSKRTPELKTHEGYDWVYVLNGRLRLMLGDNELTLEVGEVAEFDTRLPHWFGSASEQPVEFLSLFGQQGERMHVHVRVQSKAAGR